MILEISAMISVYDKSDYVYHLATQMLMLWEACLKCLFAGMPQISPGLSLSATPIPFLTYLRLFFPFPTLCSLTQLLFSFLLLALCSLLCLLLPVLPAAVLPVPSLICCIPHTGAAPATCITCFPSWSSLL